MRNLDVISPERVEKKSRPTSRAERERERGETHSRASLSVPPFSRIIAGGSTRSLRTPKESRFDTPVRYVTDVHTSTFIDFHARSRAGKDADRSL